MYIIKIYTYLNCNNLTLIWVSIQYIWKKKKEKSLSYAHYYTFQSAQLVWLVGLCFWTISIIMLCAYVIFTYIGALEIGHRSVCLLSVSDLKVLKLGLCRNETERSNMDHSFEQEENNSFCRWRVGLVTCWRTFTSNF